MLYVRFEFMVAVQAYTFAELETAFPNPQERYELGRAATIQSRNDWRSLAEVQTIAQQLQDHTGELYEGTDAGAHVSPRYDVIAMPNVGDAVSYYFNGDSTPCGHIVAVSASRRVITTRDGESVKRFYRRRMSGAWVNAGTWSLQSGHVHSRNPSF